MTVNITVSSHQLSYVKCLLAGFRKIHAILIMVIILQSIIPPQKKINHGNFRERVALEDIEEKTESIGILLWRVERWLDGWVDTLTAGLTEEQTERPQDPQMQPNGDTITLFAQIHWTLIRLQFKTHNEQAVRTKTNLSPISDFTLDDLV